MPVTQPDFARMRTAMIDSQLRPNGVTTDRIVDAFRAVPREQFVPEKLRAFAYYDEDIEIAPGRYMMEPLTLGRLLENARPQAGERALVIGGGTGYSARLLARLGLEVVLLEDAALMQPVEGAASIETVSGDLSAGHADGGPYDIILIEGFIERLPPEILAQAAEGGRIATVILDEGTPRAGIGRVYGSHVGWSFFAESYIPPLAGFARTAEFTF